MKRSKLAIEAHLIKLNLKPVSNYRLINKYLRRKNSCNL